MINTVRVIICFQLVQMTNFSIAYISLYCFSLASVVSQQAIKCWMSRHRLAYNKLPFAILNPNFIQDALFISMKSPVFWTWTWWFKCIYKHITKIVGPQSLSGSWPGAWPLSDALIPPLSGFLSCWYLHYVRMPPPWSYFGTSLSIKLLDEEANLTLMPRVTWG